MLKQPELLIVATFVFLCAVLLCRGTELKLGHCELSCDDKTSISTLFPTKTVYNGRPGKMGPKGDRGPKGPPGRASCDCPEFEQLKKRVKHLENMVSALNNVRTSKSRH